MATIIPFPARPPLRPVEAVTLPFEERPDMTVEEILKLAARVDAERERIRSSYSRISTPNSSAVVHPASEDNAP